MIVLVGTWKIHPNLDHLLSREYIGLTFRASFVLIVTLSGPRGTDDHFLTLVEKKGITVSKFFVIICEIKVQKDLCIFYSLKILKNQLNGLINYQ